MTVSELTCQRVGLSASCLVSELTVSELTCQRVGLSPSCLVSELTVSEMVCQRDVCEVIADLSVAIFQEFIDRSCRSIPSNKFSPYR